jgi:hypothetical protein
MSDPLLTAATRPAADEKPLTTAAPLRRNFTEAWRRGTERYAASRTAILDARDLETGRMVVTSPDADRSGSGGSVVYDPYSSRIPQRWMVPLQLEQQIGDLMPDVLREPATGSDASDAQAQKTESWLRAAIEQQLPWRDSVGKAVRESEWAAYLLPSSAAWERRPTFMDGESEAIRRQWWQDADGQPTQDRGRLDRGRSYKAFKAAYEQHLACSLPMTYRLISALDCVPFFTRGYGKRRLELSSLLVRTLYDVEALLADGYRWRDMDRMVLPTGFSADNYQGQDGLAYLYEWFYSAENPKNPHDKIPMVAYGVGGVDTWNPRMRSRDDDDPAEAVVNLRDRYGMQRHLMGYYWGFQRAGEDDPGRRGIPMMGIWEDTILGVEGMKMAARKHANETGFRGYQFIPNPDIPPESYTQGVDGARTMRQFPLPASGEMASVPGEIKPVAPAPMSQTVNYLIESDMALLQITLPDQQQFGGGGASSGHELSVSHALFQSANSHVKEGLRQQVEDLAEWNLELASCLIETFGLDGIPVTSNQPVNADAQPGKRRPRERLMLTNTMVGGNYEVTAFYPAVGNLAEVAQENALKKDGMSTFERVAEKMGVNDPFTLRVEVERDRFLDSEQGAALKAIWLARYRGDDETAQKLIEAGALAPDGQTPMAAIAGESLGAAGGAVERMMAVAGGGAAGGGQMPGEQALGGITAGAMETGSMMQDAVATSGIPQAPQARMAGQP